MQIPNLLDRDEACRFFGGSRPINPATLYRGVRHGRYPKPERVTPDDFSDAKALGIWLVVSLLGGPLVYALAKRTGEFLFGQNKNEN